MDYKKISSTAGGKASQMYPGKQPLNESRGLSRTRAPKRTDGGKRPPQANMTGVSKYKV